MASLSRWLGICLPIVLSAFVWGQAAGTSTPSAGQGRIRLDVLVTDAAGKPVSGLSEKDFLLLDNGQPRKIVSFRASSGGTTQADSPIQMILLFDTLNNGFTELAFIRQGMEKFLKQNDGHLPMPVSLAVLNAKGVSLESSPTTDGNALAKSLNDVSASTHPRGLNQSVLSVLALDRIAKTEIGRPGRKFLVWPGGGWPISLLQRLNGISTPAEERDQRSQFADIVLLSTDLREARVTLYGGYQNAAFFDREFLKGAKKATDVDPRSLFLDVLAIQSGGRGAMTGVNRDSDLIDQLNGFVAEAGAFYTISFDPPPTDQADEYHDLKVTVGRPGLTARTNTGYYNQPEYARRQAPKQEQAAIAPAPANNKTDSLVLVSVSQLAGIVGLAKGKRDADAAKEIEHLQLTERLSTAKMAALSAQLPGPGAKKALMAVGDASVFLQPPVGEIPQRAAADLSEQRQMMSHLIDYLKTVIPKLPNFYADRFTTAFEETSALKPEKGTHRPGVMQPAGEFRAKVYYRGGKEMAYAEGPEEVGLMTEGTFGPILSTVVLDAAHSTTAWSRWEEGANGPMAVFHFRVPQATSHYKVAFPTFDAGVPLEVEPIAYQGEFGIDPNSGAIQRLVLESESPGSSKQRADIMVEYGTVTIGQKEYTCPVRSVSVAAGTSTSGAFYITRLDDVVFSGYHVFRSESRILPDFTPGP